ncbi:hypothetical protein IQ07DRAFT_600185 [Pyrenochaeta sp. DS3sAY3a]|nr:hypothetical protein IQ07DRAFT_600185 [Pyrenochaeta sp. DS3sAY3a]
MKLLAIIITSMAVLALAVSDTNHRANNLKIAREPTEDVVLAWINDENFSYTCQSSYVVGCLTDGTCHTLAKCSDTPTPHPSSCVTKTDGVACEQPQPVPGEDVDAPAGNPLAADDRPTSPVTLPNKRWKECTVNRQAVQTCSSSTRCFVAPGDLCKAGNVCYKSCACCKPSGAPFKRSMRLDEAPRPDGRLKKEKQRRSKCAVGTQSCRRNGLYKCDITGHWRKAACKKCLQKVGGEGYCVDNVPRPNGPGGRPL